MTDLDDRALVREPRLDATTTPPPRRRGNGPIFAIAAIGLVLGGLASWWWTRSPGTSAPQTAAAPEAPATPSGEASRPLPPLHQMDTFLRALLGGLSSSPELARWLATDDLITQMAHAIDRASRGQSPARDLAVLRPSGTFEISRSRPTAIDPASYARYDGLARVVSSLDARSAAAAYRTILPRLDEAYRNLGRSEGTVDQAVAVVLQLLIDTPVVRDPVYLVPGTGATYAFADARLESLRPVQKQLLRMGPDNVARVQERLREIKQAIDSTAPAAVP